MKSYTDLEQSKKLAEILPLESADMHYNNVSIKGINYVDEYRAELMEYNRAIKVLSKYTINPLFEIVPCWSLAALLSVTRNYCTRFELTLRSNKKYNLFAMTDNYVYHGFNEYPDGIDEPIDVCVALIEKLHKFKTL